MSTAQALAADGAKFIKKTGWSEGRVFIDAKGYPPNETWCFIHPTDVPERRPGVVFLSMLEGDDWETVEDEDSDG